MLFVGWSDLLRRLVELGARCLGMKRPEFEEVLLSLYTRSCQPVCVCPSAGDELVALAFSGERSSWTRGALMEGSSRSLALLPSPRSTQLLYLLIRVADRNDK